LVRTNPDAALREVEQIAERSLDASSLYSIAGVQARAAGSDAQRAARAVELLRQATSKGFRDIDQLKKDENFDSVRKRDDFQRVLRDLEAKAKPGKS
jgi:hypothetical protein